MTMLITDKWRSALCSVFGKRKALKGWKQVSRDILAVAYGIKSAYLFDRWLSSPEQMLELLQVLYDEELTSVKLDLVVVTTDLIIYSRNHFKAHVQRLNETVKFVDVSFSLPSPSLADSSCSSMIKDTRDSFSSFIDFVSHSNSLPSPIDDDDCDMLPCTSSNSNQIAPWYEVQVTHNVNPSSLFGLFLGYPFVYWFDTTYTDENCLAMHPFRLFKVKAQDITYYNLNNSSNHQFQSKECVLRLNEVEYDFDHVLYSFSVPEEVLEANPLAEGLVLDWFWKWRSSTQWNKMFSHVWLESITVTLQSVAL